MDAEQQKKDAIAKGETLPTEDKFDSNCITPGFLLSLSSSVLCTCNCSHM